MTSAILSSPASYPLPRSPLGFVERACVAAPEDDGEAIWQLLDTYTATYIREGSGVYSEPERCDRVVVSGDLFFCFPDIPYRFEPSSGPRLRAITVTFGGPVFDLWRDARLLRRDRSHLHLEPAAYWFSRFERLFDRPQGDADEQTTRVAALQHLLAEMLGRPQRSGVALEEQCWLIQAKSLLEAVERAEELDLGAIAAAMHMSYSRFRRKFVTLAGVPPGRYHAEKLMERACDLIYQRGYTNKELADRCGFSNEFHFSQRFKQVIGVPPREYRRRLHTERTPDPG